MAMENNFDEESALKLLKEGSEKGFEDIYRHFWEPLFNQAYHRLKDEQEVKELIQDLFTELWQKRESIEIHTSLGAFLQTALRYKIFNHYKAATVKERYTTSIKNNKFSSNEVEEHINYGDLNNALNRALNLLPVQPRRVYELKYNQGMSYAEIASSLAISVSTVEKHIIKAMKCIRAQLKGYM